jgi:triosephosphate isomerase
MNKRRKIVAGNWKMNLDLNEAAAWIAEVESSIKCDHCDVFVFPSHILISDLMDMYEGDQIMFGAQNCSAHESGAFTGQVSAAQLASVGVELVLIGHSEPREQLNETHEMLREKVRLALKHDITPVFCCGEPLTVRNEGKQQEYVKSQLEDSLFTLSSAAISEVIIAYEPVWAIGTGLNATPEQAQEMHAFIRAEIAAKYGDKVAQALPILYGGSCKPDNAKQLFSCPDVDGGLIGGASLKSGDFLAIVKAAE